jgi:hypothetical protein
MGCGNKLRMVTRSVHLRHSLRSSASYYSSLAVHCSTGSTHCTFVLYVSLKDLEGKYLFSS